jgi:serine/threonine protein phosphatase 1
MRLLAIGDIHGCLRSLIALLDAVSPQPEDKIITLGDYVDRGPDSRGVLDHLIGLHDEGRLVALRGNHDLMMLEARHGRKRNWLACGGRQALKSYGFTEEEIKILGGDPCLYEVDDLMVKIPDRHWQFLEKDCKPWHETETHIFVHANLYPDVPMDEQPEFMLYWERLIEPCPHVSGKVVVCGHTKQKSGLPLDLESTVCLDTGAYDDGWLTCLDVQSGRIWQANELGKARTGWLQECKSWNE